MQGPEQALIDRAGALLDHLAGYVAVRQELHTARDLVRAATWRAIGPHRAGTNARRLAMACERAHALLDRSDARPGRGAQ